MSPDFVCLAGVDWWHDSHAHSEVQLMRRIAGERTVLFVNSVGLRVPAPGRVEQPLRRIARKIRNTLRLLQTPDPALPRFHVLSPIVLPFYETERGRRIKDRFLRWQIELVCRRLGIAEPAVVVTLPTAWGAVRSMARHSLIVNKADKYSTLPDVDTGLIATFERELLDHADRVIYVSHRMMEEDAAVVGDRGVFLDHGVDTDHFRRRPPAEWPADVAAVPGPRLGYFGQIAPYKTDLALLARVARSLPHARLVLIGDALCDLDELTALDNVDWLGPRSYDEIPAYGSAFDVALMPYDTNEWVGHINPIKLKEYLALGLPVVSTPVPEAGRYARFVRFAADADEFVVAIEKALADGDADAGERRAAVEPASWASKAAELLAVVDGVRAGAADHGAVV